jgi:predicted AAA+ superfamily ATPase
VGERGEKFLSKVVHKNVSIRPKVVHKNAKQMERDLYKTLINWKKSENRKPLVLNGARQVGKTWLLTEFARREYAKVAMFSLDRNARARKVFEDGGQTSDLLLSLSALSAIPCTWPQQ